MASITTTIPPAPLTAKQRVLATPELMEHILASASIRTILNCQRVSHYLNSLTKISKPIQRALWLIPDENLAPLTPGNVRVNPLLLEHAEEADWVGKCTSKRDYYPQDFLMSIVSRSTEQDRRGYYGRYPYRSSTMESRSKNRVLMKREGEKTLRKLQDLEASGIQTPRDAKLQDLLLKSAARQLLPGEVSIKDIDIVTGRVRFLEDLLEGEGSWKGMILFQPNPFEKVEATFGYWTYQDKSSLDVLRCNGGKWAEDLKVEDVLKTVLRLHRDTEMR